MSDRSRRRAARDPEDLPARFAAAREAQREASGAEPVRAPGSWESDRWMRLRGRLGPEAWRVLGTAPGQVELPPLSRLELMLQAPPRRDGAVSQRLAEDLVAAAGLAPTDLRLTPEARDPGLLAALSACPVPTLRGLRLEGEELRVGRWMRGGLGRLTLDLCEVQPLALKRLLSGGLTELRWLRGEASDEALEALSQATSLRRLGLRRLVAGWDLPRLTATLPEPGRIEALALDRHQQTGGRELTALPAWTGLRRLLWRPPLFFGDELEDLEGLPRLEALTLTRTREMREAGWSRLGRLTGLRELTLVDAKALEAAQAEALCDLTRLRSLRFPGEDSWTMTITEAAVAKLLERLPQLTELDLSSASRGVTGEALEGARHLRRLDLSHCIAMSPAGFAATRGLAELEVLALPLYHAPLPAAVAGRLRGWRAMRALSIDASELQPADLDGLSESPDLVELNLVAGAEGRGWLAALAAAAPRLRRLSLRRAEGGSWERQDLEDLASLEDLEQLSLQGWRLRTLDDVAPLRRLRRLRILSIHVSVNLRSRLREQAPELWWTSNRLTSLDDPELA